MYHLKLVSYMCIAMILGSASAFVSPTFPAATNASPRAPSLSMMDPTIAASLSETASVAMTSGSGFMLAETEAWVKPTATVLGPFLNFMVRSMV